MQMPGVHLMQQDSAYPLSSKAGGTRSFLRPLPTPCRAPGKLPAPPTFVHGLEPHDLTTLLDASRMLRPDDAFFEARVLLEALTAHCRAQQRPPLITAAAPRTGRAEVLSLASLLPKPPAGGPRSPEPGTPGRRPFHWPDLPRHLDWETAVTIGSTPLEFTLQQLHAFISSATAQLNWQQAASFASILPFDSLTFQEALLPLCTKPSWRSLDVHRWVFHAR